MPSFKIIGLLVLEKKIFKGFYHIWAGGHLDHVTCTIYINFLSHFPRRIHMKFGIDWPMVSEKKMFENNGHIHVYSPRTGADKPLRSFFS